MGILIQGLIHVRQITLPTQTRRYDLNKVGMEQGGPETGGPETGAQTSEEGKLGKLGTKGAQHWSRAGDKASGDNSVTFCCTVQERA